MKCTCGKEFTEGQIFCSFCKRPLNRPGYGIPGDTALYTQDELKTLKKHGSLKPDDVVIVFPSGDEVSAGSVIPFNEDDNASAPPPAAGSRRSDIRIAAIIVSVFLLAGVLTAWGLNYGVNRLTEDPEASEILSGTGAVPKNSALTYANYLKISDGMSKSEVCGILGYGCEEASSSSYEDITTKIYVWGDYPNITVCFTNDKVVSKAQIGLSE